MSVNFRCDTGGLTIRVVLRYVGTFAHFAKVFGRNMGAGAFR